MLSQLLLLPLFAMNSASDPMETEKCKTSPLLKEIRFLEKFVPDMQNGKKVATTRRGIRCVTPGQKLPANSPDGQKQLGELIVTSAAVLRFDDISENLAKAENTTVDGLKRGLIAIYGPEIKNQDLTAIYFKWFPDPF